MIFIKKKVGTPKYVSFWHSTYDSNLMHLIKNFSKSYKEGRIKPTKGTLIFFPSYYLHKVHKVTKGTRYSLVTWFVGNRFL